MVVVRRVADVRQFYERVAPYLLRDEAAHNLLLGLCSMLMQTDDYREPPYLAHCEAGGEIVGVALRTPPHRLVLSRMADDSAVRALAEDAYAAFPDLPGALAIRPVDAAFTRYWRELSGREVRLLRAERIFRLERVIPVSGVAGGAHIVGPDDLDLIVDWLIAFSAEALDDAPPREDAERITRSRLEGDPAARGLRLWKVDGRPVSLAGYTGPTPNGIRIGPVYTPPQYRGCGYASALTAALSAELLEQGRSFVFLFTDLQNPTSNHIYQAIGYEPVCDVNEYVFAGGAS